MTISLLMRNTDTRVFRAAALAAAEYKIKKDSEFAYRAVEVEPGEIYNPLRLAASKQCLVTRQCFC